MKIIDSASRIILSTGHIETQAVWECMNLGCRGMLQKHFSLEKLFEVVADALS